MKFRALKELPQGQMPGDVFEPDTDDMGDVLVSVGAAERVIEPDAKADKKHYKRRDLTAEDR
jgi:hypothetical protein